MSDNAIACVVDLAVGKKTLTGVWRPPRQIQLETVFLTGDPGFSAFGLVTGGPTDRHDPQWAALGGLTLELLDTIGNGVVHEDLPIDWPTGNGIPGVAGSL